MGGPGESPRGWGSQSKTGGAVSGLGSQAVCNFEGGF